MILIRAWCIYLGFPNRAFPIFHFHTGVSSKQRQFKSDNDEHSYALGSKMTCLTTMVSWSLTDVGKIDFSFLLFFFFTFFNDHFDMKPRAPWTILYLLSLFQYNISLFSNISFSLQSHYWMKQSRGRGLLYLCLATVLIHLRFISLSVLPQSYYTSIESERNDKKGGGGTVCEEQG